MVNISLVSDISTGTQLAFKFVDLEYPEKEYQEFKIGIKGQGPIVVPSLGLESYESGVIILDGLIPETVYEVVGQAKCQEVWSDVRGSAFITQVKPPNFFGDSKPVDRFRGGVVV